MNRRVLIVVNAEWYFASHRLPLARALRDRGDHVAVAAAVERGEGDRIEREGIRFLPLSLKRRSVNPLREGASLGELVRLYRRERPDLVHHVTIKPVIYGSIAARMTGVTRVVNALPGLGHVFTEAGRRPILRHLVELGFRFALRGAGTRTILQNPDDLEQLVSRGLLDGSKAALIRGAGVDVEAFRPRPEPGGSAIVVMASRLLWDKGVADFVEAARLLSASGASCRMVLVGSPDPENPGSVPQEQLRAWSEKGLVEWWGQRADMPEVLGQAAIVALPSAYAEGVPKVLLEAAAAGRPIVATDMPGCREVVRHEVNGLLIPARNPIALARALRELLDAPERRTEMGRQGRAIAIEEFAEEKVVNATLAVYDELFRTVA